MASDLRRMAIVLGAAVACGATVLASARRASADVADDLRAIRSTVAAERVGALREIVRRGPAELRPAFASLRTALRRSLTKDVDPTVRGLSARALLHLEGDAAVGAVIDATRSERDPAAEAALAAAWDVAASAAARKALAEAALDRTDLRLAALAAEALGALPGGLGADDLFALLDESVPWPVAAGACLGLRGAREPRTIPGLVARVGHPDPAVRSAARESLVFLTGADHGGDPRAWEAWWTKAAPTWTFPAAAPPTPAPPAVGANADDAASRATSDAPRAVGGSPTWAEFFGLPIRGSRVAFVIDYSQSMWGVRRERAEREMIDAVKALPSTARVTVLLFNERVWSFRDAPFPARPQEKFDLVSYLPAQETKSYTNLCDAVESALGLLGDGPSPVKPAPGIDDVIVLSDGVPNRGRLRDPDRICEAVKALNAGRARIHCVALAEQGTALLRRLASENGGGYVASPVSK